MNRIPEPPPALTSALADECGSDLRSEVLDADLGELILFIGRIRRELDAGSPLHCPDMKPLARRAERILGLVPQLPRSESQRLLPRLQRVMTELDAVESTLRERKQVLDTALAGRQRAMEQKPPTKPDQDGPGQNARIDGPLPAGGRQRR